MDGTDYTKKFTRARVVSRSKKVGGSVMSGAAGNVTLRSAQGSSTMDLKLVFLNEEFLSQIDPEREYEVEISIKKK